MNTGKILDRILISGIRVMGCHGANPGEKDHPQPFDIHISMDVDLLLPSHTDNLADTVDYSTIHQKIVKIVEDNSFNLLERLAAEIADMLFSDKRITFVDISIGKPYLLNGSTATVVLRRGKSI